VRRHVHDHRQPPRRGTERGRCPETKLFDANFSVTDGELHLDDFYGIAQVDVFLATQPLEKVD
jgi:hypothetical protein